MRDIRVTVAMPAYDIESLVPEAIESVLEQDFDGFELVVVDDASRDETADRIASFARHPQVRVLRNSSNLGSGASRNRILEIARGEYYLPCDADDLLFPGALATLSRLLDERPDVGVVYGELLQLETDSGALREAPKIIGRDAGDVWDLYENVVNHGGCMMRCELMRQVGGYETGGGADDRGLFLKLAEVTKIHYLPGHLYYVWRRRPEGQSRTAAVLAGQEGLIRAAIARRARRKGVQGPPQENER